MSDKTPIEADFSVSDPELGRIEMKVRFFIDGKKYAFRCTRDELERLMVPHLAVVPFVEFNIKENE